MLPTVDEFGVAQFSTRLRSHTRVAPDLNTSFRDSRDAHDVVNHRFGHTACDGIVGVRQRDQKVRHGGSPGWMIFDIKSVDSA
ncbi:hypothetical protein D3C74_454970 [compost metagenome]